MRGLMQRGVACSDLQVRKITLASCTGDHWKMMQGFRKGGASAIKNLLASVGQEDALELEMAAHSSIVAWEIPWTGEPGRLQSTGSKSQTRLKGTDQRCLWATEVETIEVTRTGLGTWLPAVRALPPTPSKAVLPNNTSIRIPHGKCEGLKRRVCDCSVFLDRVPSSQSVHLINWNFVRC